ncbi:MAG: SAM-dependent methyltransferase, partial [Actinomycetia bacterium]|nr:SAM-dependent methyltransferase [Actinomycetes bacterium]
MNRAPSTGRVAFVGSGPGDPGLLTVRARDAIAAAPLIVTDPDVPEAILALAAEGAEVRPAVGQPADVARDLVAEARNGRTV